ncbi:MAG: AraC family chitin signaling transcriptional activator [Maribacter sp.]|jgi:ligand-binding sensor domain-containing protein/DNA-binding CsgD family transcriptional regulator
MLRKSFLFLLLISLSLSAQELPPIQNFSPLDYNGENQNWAITQGEDKHIFIANNHSLLEYDGVRWRKYYSPNNSIIRSVHANGDLILTGQYMEFGFWQRNGFGELAYTSISSQMEFPMVEDEEFWNIVTLGNWVLFQSLDRIYSYNIKSKQFKWIEAKSIKAHIFKVNDAVYYQNQNKDIYLIKSGEPILAIDAASLQDRKVVGMYEEQGKLVLILDNAKFLQVVDTKLITRAVGLLKPFGDIVVYATEKLKDGTYILGTISDGVYQIDFNGELIRSINRGNGLSNNTILSVFEDADENLWLGLDNGISVINMNSPFNEYNDNSGQIGSVYTSKFYQNKLYLGTNQGLFVRDFGSKQGFELVGGTEGQVWSLDAFDGYLLCGHNNGTYLIKDDTADLISTFPGTWDIKRIEGQPNLFLQGNYNGISILEKKGGDWSYRNKLEGFDISTRFFEIIGNNKVLVNHEIKGLYSLSIDEGFRKVKDIETHSQMGYGSSLVKYNNQIIYSSVNGAFIKESGSLSFMPDSILNRLLINEAGGISSIALPDKGANKLWYFTKNGLSMISPEVFSQALSITTIPIPSFFRGSLGVVGFENINRITDDKYLIGISNGLVTLDLEKRKGLKYIIEISSVKNHSEFRDALLLPLSSHSELAFEANSLSFSYTVPQYDKYSEVSYQYRIQGLFEDWSTWSFEPIASFNNLMYGDYVFEVRAKIGNTITTNTASYSFSVNRPWYLSYVALVIYCLAVIGFFLVLHRVYKRYYTVKQQRVLADEKRRLKRKKLKTEKLLAQLKNENLSVEIESKNRELAVSTMSIIKKNEFLNNIKEQLKKADNPTQIKSVIKTIDRNLTNEDDWKFFEEAFNNADKDFLKKIKEAHPILTPNDLRLCAYLRLNLASKEIAPLLNISVRSVEVKRYRLRKKMDLPHENSLTAYIIEL